MSIRKRKINEDGPVAGFDPEYRNKTSFNYSDGLPSGYGRQINLNGASPRPSQRKNPTPPQPSNVRRSVNGAGQEFFNQLAEQAFINKFIPLYETVCETLDKWKNFQNENMGDVTDELIQGTSLEQNPQATRYISQPLINVQNEIANLERIKNALKYSLEILGVAHNNSMYPQYGIQESRNKKRTTIDTIISKVLREEFNR